jgi:hypothetical protein
LDVVSAPIHERESLLDTKALENIACRDAARILRVQFESSPEKGPNIHLWMGNIYRFST